MCEHVEVPLKHLQPWKWVDDEDTCDIWIRRRVWGIFSPGEGPDLAHALS